MYEAPDATPEALSLFVRQGPGVSRHMRTGAVRLSYRRLYIPNGNATLDTQTFHNAIEALATFARWQTQQPERWSYMLTDQTDL